MNKWLIFEIIAGLFVAVFLINVTVTFLGNKDETLTTQLIGLAFWGFIAYQLDLKRRSTKPKK